MYHNKMDFKFAFYLFARRCGVYFFQNYRQLNDNQIKYDDTASQKKHLFKED
jgi:hypothetical protein